MKIAAAFVTLALAVAPAVLAMPSVNKQHELIARVHRDNEAAYFSIKKRDNAPTDEDILNYALTLEHLEATFYAEALGKFSASDFASAGFPDWVRGRITQIGDHEKEHVKFLSGALGDKATQACTYKFPYTDVPSFVFLARALETIGTSAYTGAAQFITSKDYLTGAASVLATEARHSAWLNSAVRKQNPWSGPFQTPLDLNQVYTLASALITSCPPSNPTLPVKAFPTLTPATQYPAPGGSLTFTFPSSTDTANKSLFAAFINELTTKFVPIGGANDDGKGGKTVTAVFPSDMRGPVYVVITSDGGSVKDEVTVAGPAQVFVPFDSRGNVIPTPS